MSKKVVFWDEVGKYNLLSLDNLANKHYVCASNATDNKRYKCFSMDMKRFFDSNQWCPFRLTLLGGLHTNGVYGLLIIQGRFKGSVENVKFDVGYVAVRKSQTIALYYDKENCILSGWFCNFDFEMSILKAIDKLNVDLTFYNDLVAYDKVPESAGELVEFEKNAWVSDITTELDKRIVFASTSDIESLFNGGGVKKLLKIFTSLLKKERSEVWKLKIS